MTYLWIGLFAVAEGFAIGWTVAWLRKKVRDRRRG